MRQALAGAILGVLVQAGCARTLPHTQPIEFLTRSECVQTSMMRATLDEAITGLTTSLTYTVVDLDTLTATDARKGYPTPTVLVGGIDLFGMPAPRPPFPDPT